MSDKNKFQNKTIKSNLLYTKLANVFKFRLFKNELDRKIKIGIIHLIVVVIFSIFIIRIKYFN
jgi:hypothetical protein